MLLVLNEDSDYYVVLQLFFGDFSFDVDFTSNPEVGLGEDFLSFSNFFPERRLKVFTGEMF